MTLELQCPATNINWLILMSSSITYIKVNYTCRLCDYAKNGQLCSMCDYAQKLRIMLQLCESIILDTLIPIKE